MKAASLISLPVTLEPFSRMAMDIVGLFRSKAGQRGTVRLCNSLSRSLCRWYDRRARLREFERGDPMLVPLPTKADKLMARPISTASKRRKGDVLSRHAR